jgi:hypothetical protein
LGLTNLRVLKLAIDPATPTTLYAGVLRIPFQASGGVFKSTDGGASWFPLFGVGALLSWGALVVDPVNPTTLYAATDGQVRKSMDGGASWTSLNGGSSSPPVKAIAADPAASETVYAGTDLGVFLSLDGGNSWSSFSEGLTTPAVAALSVDPIAPGRLYAGTVGGGVFDFETVPFMALDLNPSVLRSGGVLQVDVRVANTGTRLIGDVFFGALLDPTAGPGLGCPNGDAVAFVAEAFARIEVRCLSSAPASFPALFRGVGVPGLLPPTTRPGFFRTALPSGSPLGTHTLFLVLTRLGALADNSVDAGDIVAAATASLTVVP